MGVDADGRIRIQEYTTAQDGLSINRQQLLEDLSKYGGTVVGKGKGEFTGGIEVPKGTQIEVISQKTGGTTIEVVSPELRQAAFDKFDELALNETSWNTPEKQAHFKETIDHYAELAVRNGAVGSKAEFYEMYASRQYDYPESYKTAVKQPYLENGASSFVNGQSIEMYAFGKKNPSIGRADAGNFVTSVSEDAALLFDADGHLKSGQDIAMIKGLPKTQYDTGIYQYEYSPELVQSMDRAELIRFPNGDTPGASSLNIPGARTWAGADMDLSQSELLMPPIDTSGYSYTDFLEAVNRQGYFEITNPTVIVPGTSNRIQVPGILKITKWSD